MNAKKLSDLQQRLTDERDKLVMSLKRSQQASEEIKLEQTEDEGDLASISHDRDLLYSLHEGSFTRLQMIRKAIEAIEGGQYGECVRCEEAINEKRLDAVPWAEMCISCQEESEVDRTTSTMSLAGIEPEAEL